MNLIEAAQKGLYLEVEKALNEGQPTHMQDTAGFSAMHWAAIRGHSDIIDLLARRGANLNQTGTRLALTPLHMASLANRSEAIQKLISLGANKEAMSANGQTALDIALLINQKADFVLVLAKIIPGLDIINKLDRGFDSVFTLLLNEAQIHHDEDLEEVAINALTHDRADVLAALSRRGFDYKKLNDESYLMCGFDYAVIVAAANFSANCLQFLYELNPNMLKPDPVSVGGMLKSNILMWMNQQLPEREVFVAPYLFFQSQEGRQLKREELTKYLPPCLRTCDVTFAYDNEQKRYAISKVLTGVAAVYFDANGQVKNLSAILNKLRATLQFLRDHGVDINACDKSKELPSKYLINCPIDILKVYQEFGVKFSGEDLQAALAKAPADVIRVMLETGAPVDWADSKGKTALDVLSSVDNDLLLNDRPALMAMMKEMSQMALLQRSMAQLSVQTPAYEPAIEESYQSAVFNQYKQPARKAGEDSVSTLPRRHSDGQRRSTLL